MIKIDTNFAKLAINYLENPNYSTLNNIAELSATEHIYYHCTKYNPDPNLKFDNKRDFLKHILSDINLKKDIENYKKLVQRIDKYTGLDNEIEDEALKALPKGVFFSTNMYVTLGYFSTGSVDEKENFNVDLTYGFENINEFIYISIHELHHVGFSKYKKMPISSISDIKTHGDMLDLMIYLLHAEGLATYAPFYKMKNENRLVGSDYCDFNNNELMSQFHNIFMDAYKQLSSHNHEIISSGDLINKYLMPLDNNRLLYKFGLYICLRIEDVFGKDKLINSITQPEGEFVEMIHSLKFI